MKIRPLRFKLLKWLVATVVTTIVLGASGSVAVADTAQHDEEGVATTSLASCFTEEELQDTSSVAENLGISLEEAMERFCGVNKFNLLWNELAVEFPDLFVDAEWGHGEGLIVGRPGSAKVFQQMVDTAGVRVSVVEADLPTGTDQQRLVRAVAEQILQYVPEAYANTHYDYASNSVEVVVSEAPDLERLRAVVSEAVESAGGTTWAVGVQVELDKEFAVVPYVQGGGNYASGSCTGGFIGVRGGVRGIITAKHCTTTPSNYDGATTGATHASANYDLRITLFTSGSSTPTFRVGTGYSDYRNVTGTALPGLGAQTCKFGQVTKYGCTTVLSRDNMINSSGTIYIGMVFTTNDIATHGDSGGPWFNGTLAHGITHGGAIVGGVARGVYTAIGFTSSISTTVLTR